VVSAFAGFGVAMVVTDNTGQLGLAAIPTAPVGANPTGTIGLAAVNGIAGTFLRSDGAPALDQGIAPTWSALHTFTLAPLVSAFAGGGTQMVTASNTGALGVQTIPGLATGDIVLRQTSAPPTGYVYTGQILCNLYDWNIAAFTTAIVSAISNSAFATVGNIMYQFGGRTSGAVVNATAAIDMSLITWTSRAAPAFGTIDSAAATDGSTYIYLSGGSTGFAESGAQNYLYRYSIAGNSWTVMNPMPGVRTKHVMFYYSGKLYVFGGVNGAAALVAGVYIYDIAGNSWTTGASMSTPRKDLAGAIIGAYVYLFSGNDTAATISLSTVTEKYSIAGDSYTTVAPIPKALSAHRCFYSGNLALVVGGVFNSAGTLKASELGWVYDSLSDLWFESTSLTVPRYSAQIGHVGKNIYIFGGKDFANTWPSTMDLGIFPSTPLYTMEKT